MNQREATPWSERLRQERIARNWRQRDLAEQVGTSELTIRRWERGQQQPSAYFRIKLCTLFGKSAEELGLVKVNPSPSPSTQGAGSETESVPSSLADPPALWTVPYQRNPHFTGRDDLLEQLAQQLAPQHERDGTRTRRAVLSQPQAIKGLGGIGKTQTALEYAYRARSQGCYTHFIWINAANEEAILTSFQGLAEQLPDFAARDEKDQHKRIAAILRWLQVCEHPWLLILDNADDLSLVQSYLPQQGPGSILLTTRAHAVAALANTIEVDPMGLMEGTQFLLQRSQRLDASDEERNEASNIVIALDGFPLALDQAGAYIEETGCGFGDYRQLYEQHRTRLLARRGRQATPYPDSVATTWDLSFQKVEQTQPAATELLRLCAYLAPDHIPEELLTEGAQQWPPVLRQAVADRFTFNELIEVLLAFSLVKRLAQEHLLSVHRLVQAVQLDRIEPEEQRTWAQRVVRAIHTLFPADPKNEVARWPQCLRYLEQVQACDRLIQEHGLHLLEAAELLDRAGSYLRAHASYSLAEPLLQRALAIAEQQGEPEHPQLAMSLANLGSLYLEQGQYEQAEPLLQRALHIREEILGPEHADVAPSLVNLGILYAHQGRYEQAEPLWQRAVHIREQALGPEHPLLASPLNNLGLLYYEQERYEQAEPLLQRAWHIWEQALGPECPQVAYPLNNLGSLYVQQGQYEQAEPLLQRALHIWEQALGPEHPDVATSLNSLGHLYTQQGQHEQAQPLYQRALHIREQALGPHHSLVAETLNGLANLYIAQGQYEHAEALYRRALSIHRQSLDSQHPEVAKNLQDLAQLRQMQHHDGEALSLYQQALAIREQALGAEHPKTRETRKLLRALFTALGKTEEAQPKQAKTESEHMTSGER
jgi:tetratricopeptide (TPR) repeat protein/DNA-binding XRE family transcriptional regulator